jgi:molecular chaperone DnaJ
MNVMKNYYSILEIDEHATSADVKKAYRKLAQKYHPDRNPSEDSVSKFKEINEANEVLSDPIKRKQYDQAMHGGFGGNIGDLFESLFGGNPLGGFSGMGRQARKRTNRRPPTPGDAIVAIELTLDEIERGSATRSFKIQKDVMCKACNGVGGEKVIVCENCGGSGETAQFFQQGNMKFRSSRPCTVCMGQGQNIINICSTCNGCGTVAESATIDMTIISKKS